MMRCFISSPMMTMTEMRMDVIIIKKHAVKNGF